MLNIPSVLSWHPLTKIVLTNAEFIQIFCCYFVWGMYNIMARVWFNCLECLWIILSYFFISLYWSSSCPNIFLQWNISMWGVWWLKLDAIWIHIPPCFEKLLEAINVNQCGRLLWAVFIAFSAFFTVLVLSLLKQVICYVSIAKSNYSLSIR